MGLLVRHAAALLGLVAAVAVIGRAPAQTTAPMNANERAYTIALICVAVAANDNDAAGGLRSINASRKMAKALGYGQSRLSRDLATMASVVGDQLRKEPEKVERHRGVCRQLGLIN